MSVLAWACLPAPHAPGSSSHLNTVCSQCHYKWPGFIWLHLPSSPACFICFSSLGHSATLWIFPPCASHPLRSSQLTTLIHSSQSHTCSTCSLSAFSHYHCPLRLNPGTSDGRYGSIQSFGSFGPTPLENLAHQTAKWLFIYFH